MIQFLENMLLAAVAIFVIYVGRDHFVITALLILAIRIVQFAKEYKERPVEEGDDNE